MTALATAPAVETFDLVAWAKQHRYRTRNLCDGRPCPPCKLDTRKRTQAERMADVFRSAVDSERCDAIVGTHGYVFWQDGRLEWFVMRGLYLAKAITGLESHGCTVEQEGDSEAAGWAPPSSLDVILRTIHAGRVGVGRPGHKGNPDALVVARASKVEKGKIERQTAANTPAGA